MVGEQWEMRSARCTLSCTALTTGGEITVGMSYHASVSMATYVGKLDCPVEVSVCADSFLCLRLNLFVVHNTEKWTTHGGLCYLPFTCNFIIVSLRCTRVCVCVTSSPPCCPA